MSLPLFPKSTGGETMVSLACFSCAKTTRSMAHVCIWTLRWHNSKPPCTEDMLFPALRKRDATYAVSACLFLSMLPRKHACLGSA